MALFNIHEYRKAVQHVKELEKALKIINAAEASLRSYQKYRPVDYILTTIYENKPFLEVFLAQNQIIVDTKGETRKR